MYYKRILIVLLFTIICSKAFSAVFVVTSNADSGPGTLRDALTSAAANGSAEKDYINFNLPGNTIASVTITLQSQLPDVTGNVVIDGTTQTGASLGVSNAKVIITIATAIWDVSAFKINSQVDQNDSIEFYGLYIKGFEQGFECGINVNMPCKLIVGAPGKGNVFCDNWCAVFGNLDDVKIQSNFLGVEPDGETWFPNLAAAVAANYSFNNLVIGGDSEADGNIIDGETQEALAFGDGTGGSSMQTVTIKNNYFGTDYQGKKVIDIYSDSFINVNDADILVISSNVFSANVLAINSFNQATLSIKGNYFGTNKTQTIKLGTGGDAIDQNSFVIATVGGVDDADQNVFTGYQNPIFAINNSLTNVIKNKFYCNNEVLLQSYGNNYIRIIKLLDNEVSGDAPPGATVQLYYSTVNCTTCNPNTWFATVTANSSGVWDYVGDTHQNVMASSTIAGSTAGFQPLYVGPGEVTVINKDCHHNGSIELNEKRQGRFQFIWKDGSGKTVSTGQKIEDLDAGVYTLQISEGGGCPTAGGVFTIIDLTPHVSPQNFQLDCNNATGSFTAVTVMGNADITVANYYWEDANGHIISNAASVKNLPAGKYYLYITDSNGCNSDKELYEVLPPVGVPTINDSKVVIADADCNQADGSITGITTTDVNTGDYQWLNAQGEIISFERDLKNVTPGDYYFVDNYSFNCSITSHKFTVASKNGIVIDDSKVQIKFSSCNSNNASITGIQVTGAARYVWTDANNNKVITIIPTFLNIAPGDYTLTASNEFGCSVISRVYHVGMNTPTAFPVYNSTVAAACFQGSNGSVSVATDGLVKSSRWVNSLGQSVGAANSLQGVAAGAYRLYLTDENGCEQLYATYSVNELPAFAVADKGTTINDQCGLKTGGVTGIAVSGGAPPYTYKWLNSSGEQVASTIDITNLAAGAYKLTVADTRCGSAVVNYTITEDDQAISEPSVSNTQLCSSGNAVLSVNNALPGMVYRLYDSPVATQPIAEQASGRFNVAVTTNKSYFVTAASGTCESTRAEIDVSVGLSNSDIMNAFSPNDDGLNEYWQIKNIENYPRANIQVFTRNGQRVYNSTGYATPFNGTLNGKKLPDGVYYYIINLSSKCNILSGSLTIIR